jgi:hypothetical protein
MGQDQNMRASSSPSSFPQLPFSVEGRDSVRCLALLLASSAVMFRRASSNPSIHRFDTQNIRALILKSDDWVKRLYGAPELFYQLHLTNVRLFRKYDVSDHTFLYTIGSYFW